MSKFCADNWHLIVIDGIRYATKEDAVFYGGNASTKYDIEVAYKGITKHFRYDDKVVRDEMFDSIVAEMSNRARPKFSI